MALYSEAPPFWWTKSDWRAWALWPISSIYGAIAGRRMRKATREQIAAAVLCVGNLTVGGEGKTPIAIAVAEQAKAMGLKPGFISRGYGGHNTNPHLVDKSQDSARIVGDEPLLLARHAPTVVSRNRAQAARLLIEHGCDLLIMDDGFQSAMLHMDFALIVVDTNRGIGNGHVLPGGPLRAPLLEQLRHISGVVTMGSGPNGIEVVRQTSRAGKPVMMAQIKPLNAEDFKGKRVLAFAGIGNPDKFYDTLAQAGAEIVVRRSFGDHHPYSAEQLSELRQEADDQDLIIVTTEKDLVRIQNGLRDGSCESNNPIQALAITAVFEDNKILKRIIENTMAAARLRLIKGNNRT